MRAREGGHPQGCHAWVGWGNGRAGVRGPRPREAETEINGEGRCMHEQHGFRMEVQEGGGSEAAGRATLLWRVMGFVSPERVAEPLRLERFDRPEQRVADVGQVGLQRTVWATVRLARVHGRPQGHEGRDQGRCRQDAWWSHRHHPSTCCKIKNIITFFDITMKLMFFFMLK